MNFLDKIWMKNSQQMVVSKLEWLINNEVVDPYLEQIKRDILLDKIVINLSSKKENVTKS